MNRLPSLEISQTSFNNKTPQKFDSIANKGNCQISLVGSPKFNCIHLDRIYQVLLQLTENCKLVSVIVVIVKQLEHFQVSLEPEIWLLFKNSANNFIKYEEKLEYRENNDKYMMMESLPKKTHLKEQIKLLLAALRGNWCTTQGIYSSVKNWNVRHSPPAGEFINLLQELTVFVKGRLLTSATQVSQQQREFSEQQKGLRKNEERSKKLESHLENKTMKLNETNNTKLKIIEHLYLSLKEVTHTNEVELQKINNFGILKVEKLKKLSSERIVEYEKDIDSLKQTLKQHQEANRESEENLRRRKWRLESEVDSLIKTYDDALIAEEAILDEEEAEAAALRDGIESLTRAIESLTEEYTEILFQQHLAEEKRIAEENEKALMLQSALTIQSFWRSYKARRMMKQKQRAKPKY